MTSRTTTEMSKRRNELAPSRTPTTTRTPGAASPAVAVGRPASRLCLLSSGAGTRVASSARERRPLCGRRRLPHGRSEHPRLRATTGRFLPTGVVPAALSVIVATPTFVLVCRRLIAGPDGGYTPLVLVVAGLALLSLPASFVALATSLASLGGSAYRFNAAWVGVVAALFPPLALLASCVWSWWPAR